MKKLILVRHATTSQLETGDVETREWDEYLSEAGILQAKTLARRLSRATFDAIYSSPQPRAKVTAYMISKKVEIVSDLEDWREGETHQEMYDRVINFVDSLDGVNIIVSHGSPIAIMLSSCVHAPILSQASWGITPASISVIQDGAITAVNDTAHLGINPEIAVYDASTWTYRK